MIRDLKLELARVSDLVPHARNARPHTPEQVAKIAASIVEFKWTNPVLTDGEGGILAGHGRVLAAELLGLDVVPTIALGHLSPAQRRAYVIADNRLAELAGWDAEILAGELGALRDEGFDTDLVGFTGDEVDGWLALAARTVAGRTDPDAAPPLPAEVETVSRPGDVWALGPHRVTCGDSESEDVVARLFEGQKQPRLMVTDPPYGVGYDSDWRERQGLSDAWKPVSGKIQNDDRSDWRKAWALFGGAVAYVWHDNTRGAHVVAGSLEAAGFEIRSQIVWLKQRAPISRSHYHRKHESAFYAVKPGEPDDWQDVPPERFAEDHAVLAYAVAKGETAGWEGGRKQSDVWEIVHVRSETGHPTQKPVEAMRRPVENNSRPGDAVFDPFLGSGTTLIGCEMTGRLCLGVELDPRFVDVSVMRWQDFTGHVAVLASTGEAFSEVRAARVEGVKPKRGKRVGR